MNFIYSLQSVNVATIMLDAAKTKRHQAMKSLEKIGKKTVDC